MRRQSYNDINKELIVARENARTLRDVHQRAVEAEQRWAKISEPKRTKEQESKYLEAVRWTETTRQKLSGAEFDVQQLERSLRRISDRAKGCVTPNGSRIRV